MAVPKLHRKTEAEKLYTPANVVTLIRIFSVPIFVVLLLSPWPAWFPTVPGLEVAKPWVATIFFIVLAVTDSLDGYLARSRNEVTTFGKFMDPLADKLLVCSALIALVELGILPAWVVIVIIARDFIMSGIRLVAASKGEVIAASWYGKFKTAFQMVAIVMFMLRGSVAGLFGERFALVFEVLAWLVMGIALVLTIVSLVDYFLKARYLLGFARPEEAAESGEDPGDAEESEGLVALQGECLELAGRVVASALEKGVTLATCESLTGGMISGFLTSVPGSSAAIRGGLVTYAVSSKEALAGVSGARLAETGPVDGEVAKQMATGAQNALKCDVAVAVTGIAGPAGAEEGKPVGTVWFGLAGRDVRAERRQFDGGRQEVRLQTVRHALELLEAEIGSR
ncbi:MAG: CDP-diacylglycerol--glycerol-3-phosphate 3-phosphatidyltransferase [Eggerthellaceae bacterium]|nr:CDP-diacylglycerol--glycerol-3-phosphate 3-phosphatidyltransferase [Eggerthellaceae bacterium]